MTKTAAAPRDASTIVALAVLVEAGITPEHAWRHLAESGDSTARAVMAGVADGVAVADTLRRQGGAWREVGAAWEIAVAVGAPLGHSLRAIASALRDAEEARADVRVALAEPTSTARLMSWLPLVGVGLAFAMGFNVIGTVMTNPIGLLCAAVGIALVFVARAWTTRMVTRARPPDGVPGIGPELLAIALSAGASIDKARSFVEGAGYSGAADTVLRLSRSAGVPAVELLRATAALERHEARTDGRARAARLSSRLLIPLGVCTLPAFLLLGVAPMLLSVIASSAVVI